MDNGTLLGIAGLAATVMISIAGFYFTYRARTDAMRERVYGQQLGLLLKAADVFAEARTLATVLSAVPREYAAEAIHELKRVPGKAASLDHEAALILPASLVEEFTKTARAITELAAAAEFGQDVTSKAAPVLQRVDRFAELARAHLGVDRLSDETVRLLGTQKSARGRASA